MRRETRVLRSLVVVALATLPLVLGVGCANGESGGDDGRAPDTSDETSTAPPGQSVTSIYPPVGQWRLAPNDSGSGATFSVKEGGDFSGVGPCNSYFGKWSLGATQNTLGPVGATRKMCAPEVMDFEQGFFAKLGRVAGWRVTVGGMALVDTDGGALLHFVRAD